MDSLLASSAHPHREVEFVAGVDEAGRGCLAGPVVAACVVLPSPSQKPLPPFIRDSKQLSPAQREQACQWIYRHALEVSVALATPQEIDRINILQASLLAMQRCVLRCALPLRRVLIDGNMVPPHLPCPAEAIPHGDSQVAPISAASIVAKVVRDHLMQRLDRLLPEYGFAQHKGYPTPQHWQAIRRHGLSPLHRYTFCRRLTLPLEETSE